MKKAQSSLEFIMIFGLGFFLILIISAAFFTYSNDAKIDLDTKQMGLIGEEIMSNVEKIYYLGEGNKITLKTKFPDGIENMTISHNNGTKGEYDQLNFWIYSGESLVPVVFGTQKNYIRFNCTNCRHDYSTNISFYNDTSMFSSGSRELKIESYGDYVSIDFKKE